MALADRKERVTDPTGSYLESANDGDNGFPVTNAPSSDTTSDNAYVLASINPAAANDHSDVDKKRDDDRMLFMLAARMAQLRRIEEHRGRRHPVIHAFRTHARRAGHHHGTRNAPVHNQGGRHAFHRAGAHLFGRAPAYHGRIPSEIAADPANVILARWAKYGNEGMNFHPDFAGKALQVAEILRAQGYHFVVSSGVRSRGEQRDLRRRMGHRGGPRVAAKRSMHEFGLAADFGYRGGPGGRAAFYRALAEAARDVGLETGADYREKDRCHISIPREDFLARLADGKYQRIVPEAAWRILANATTGRRPILARNAIRPRQRPISLARRSVPHLRVVG